MTPEERKVFANKAEEAIVHPLVQDVLEEYRQNMRGAGKPIERGTLENYGLLKCLSTVAQIARAQALDVDPSELRVSPAEAAAHMARMAQTALDAGKPVISIEVEPTAHASDAGS